MVRVYYHDNVVSDQRLPHEGEPCAVKALEELGLYAVNIREQEEVHRIAKEKGYVNYDAVAYPLIIQIRVELTVAYCVTKDTRRQVSFDDSKFLPGTSPYR